MTSFSRLAKVIKGYTPPVGWIERAFASLATAIHSVLPEYTISDVDKVLTIDKDEGHEPVPIWKAVRQTPVVGTNDKGKYLHTNDSTGDLEWDSVRQTPAVGENDKDKYLHTNASTGALEWGSVASGGEKTPDITISVYAIEDISTGELTIDSVDKTYDEVYASGTGIIHEVYAEIVLFIDDMELYRYRSTAAPAHPTASSQNTYTFNQDNVSFKQIGTSLMCDTLVFTLDATDATTLNEYNYTISPTA